LGAVVAEATEITEEMFYVASTTLAGLVSQERLDRGALYPDQSELRRVSFEVASAIVRYASQHNLGRRFDDDEAEARVRAAVWDPSYVPVHHPEE
jgi:malate dehydrogenase (oxaloacetate-decarboxylating)(NADP+)